MKKRDIILLISVAAAAVVLLVLGLALRKGTDAPDADKTVAELSAVSQAAESPAPSEISVPEEVTAAAQAYLDQYPAESYLIIRTSTSMYMPFPLNEDASFKVHFGDEEYNLVHIGKNSVYMEESTCDNQNCVGQGEITLENRDSRILFNMILCLPHELSLELVDPAEALDYVSELLLMQAAMSAAEVG